MIVDEVFNLCSSEECLSSGNKVMSDIVSVVLCVNFLFTIVSRGGSTW